MTRVLVLGAGGFLGRHLLHFLSTTPDLVPVALLRSAAKDIPVGVEVRHGDATDTAALRRALTGVDAAVNCIAGSGPTMTCATRNLCEVGSAAGLRRLVHISSMAVYGAATGTVDEDHPITGEGGAYAEAKAACEDLVRASQDLETVILRPGCIHGPCSRQWTERIGRLLSQHRIGDLGDRGDGTCNLTFIEDMLRAIAAALRHRDAVGRTFNVSDPHPSSWNCYFVDLGRGLGAVPVSRVPGWWQTVETRLLAPPLVIGERLAGKVRLGRALPPRVTPSMARLWRQEITLDHRRADEVLAFNRTPRSEAIATSARWLRARA